jgi:hypothetical protein
MGDHDDRDDSRAPGDSTYLEGREEWAGAKGAEAPTAPQARIEGGARVAPVDGLPKKKVRGVARAVELRSLPGQPERLVFRVDRYDATGNRLTPVPIEMGRYRRGLVSDGDEVEVVGRWSRGTLRASRITNLTTASEVRNWFPRGFKWIALLTGFIVVAIILVVVLALLAASSSGATAKVPDVVGRDEAAALAAIRHAGLTTETTREPSDTVPTGDVIRTEPGAGFALDKHVPVTVVVSSGSMSPGSTAPPTSPPTSPPVVNTVPPTAPPATVRLVGVPQLSLMSQDDASKALQQLGFVVGVQPEDSADVPAGFVIRTDPPAAASVAAGSMVNLFVSTPSTTTTTVPLP